MKKILISIGLFIILAAGFVVFQSAKPEAVKTAQVKIGEAIFRVEIADNFTSRARGLAGRMSLGSDEGMLFVFTAPGPHGFWMQGMRFPLDIIWIRGDRVVGFAENAPVPTEATPPTFLPPEPVDRVLEINAGLVAARGIKIGDKIEISGNDGNF